MDDHGAVVVRTKIGYGGGRERAGTGGGKPRVNGKATAFIQRGRKRNAITVPFTRPSRALASRALASRRKSPAAPFAKSQVT